MTTSGPAGWAYGKGGAVQSIQKTVTSAQLLALSSTPVQILPAPGAGKMFIILSVIYRTTGTVNYALGGSVNFGLWYGALVDAADGFAQIGQTTIFHSYIYPICGLNADLVGDLATSFLNAPITLGTSGGNPTTGDGDLTITANFIVIAP